MFKFIRLLLIFVLYLATTANSAVFQKEEILAANVAGVVESTAELKTHYSISTGNQELLTTIYSTGTKRMPREHLLFWIEMDGKGYRPIHHLQGGIGENFQKPSYFRVGQYPLLLVSSEPAGSAGFVTRTLLWIAPDQSLHPISFEPASTVYESITETGQFVLNGSDKDFFLEDDQMKFEFYLAENGDPHCCPSGGVVTGTYKITGSTKYDLFYRSYSSDLRVEVELFSVQDGKYIARR